MTNNFKKTDLSKSVDRQTFSSYITGDNIKKSITSALGSDGAQRFITGVISAVSVNKELANCDYSSIISSALLGESLKLSPSPQMGQYYIIPFNNKNSDIKKGQFVLGYKGYIQLAIRSGKYKKIIVEEIKEGELISFNPLTEELKVEMIENEDIRNEKKTMGYYAMLELVNGFTKVMYWSFEKMLFYADRYSPAFDKESAKLYWSGKVSNSEQWKYSSFWYKEFNSMAKKTMLRQLLSKWGIMSIEMQKGYEADVTADEIIEPVTKIEVIDKETGEILEEQTDNDKINDLFNSEGL